MHYCPTYQIDQMDNLSHLIEKGTIPHALLIVNGTAQAKAFAEQLVGEKREFHPDVHEIYPEGKYHPISALRTLIDDVSLTPFQAPYKVFLIHEAEKMMPASANALLKTFEEPSDRTVIMLLTSYPDRILPTILSRCQTYTFHNDEKPNMDALLDALAKEKPLPDLEVVDDYTFEVVMMWYRDLYAFHLGVSSDQLFFPDRETTYAKLTPRPLDQIEDLISSARLGVERSLKFSYVMQEGTGLI